MKWRGALGILFARRISIKLNFIRLLNDQLCSMIFESWAIKKQHIHKVNVDKKKYVEEIHLKDRISPY